MVKLLTTETHIEGISERLGIVFATNMVTTSFVKDFIAGIKDAFSGKYSGYNREIEDVARSTIEEVIRRAEQMGANAVVALRIDVHPVFTEKLKMFLVCVSGTACTLKETGLQDSQLV